MMIVFVFVKLLKFLNANRNRHKIFMPSETFFIPKYHADLLLQLVNEKSYDTGYFL